MQTVEWMNGMGKKEDNVNFCGFSREQKKIMNNKMLTVKLWCLICKLGFFE